MENLDAVMIIETEDNPSMEDYLSAWSQLIETGAVWSLQGSYGRGATSLIERGVISSDGVINWELVEELA